MLKNKNEAKIDLN